MTSNVEMLLHEIGPYHIGSRVVVREGHEYASDWRDVCIIVGITLEYQRPGGGVNIALATEDDIKHGLGSSDGWSVDDILPA